MITQGISQAQATTRVRRNGNLCTQKRAAQSVTDGRGREYFRAPLGDGRGRSYLRLDGARLGSLCPWADKGDRGAGLGDIMHLLEGVAAVLLSVCIYAWAYGKHHGPNAPGWAKGQLFASLVSLFLVAFFPLGTGFVALGLTGLPFINVKNGCATGGSALIGAAAL